MISLSLCLITPLNHLLQYVPVAIRGPEQSQNEHL